jgi:PAS domain S-box-containing protein
MMPDESSLTASESVTSREIRLILSDFRLLKEQLDSGRISKPFLGRQVETAIGLLERLDSDLKQSKGNRTDALATVSRLISSSLDLQTVLDQTMDALVQLTEADRGFLMLRNDDGELSVKVARNIDQQTLESESFQYSRTIAHQVLDTGQPILTTNAQQDDRFSNKASILSQSLRSIMAVPLRARGRTIGIAYVDSKKFSGLFDEYNLSLMEALGAQATVAIENARLFSQTDQQLTERVEELQQLRRIDLLFNQAWDAEQALSYTVEWACRLTGASSGHLALIGSGESESDLIARYHFGNQTDQPLNLTAQVPQVLDAIHSGDTLAQDSDTQATLIVPLGREGNVIGVVLLERTDAAFTDYERDLVDRMIKRASITIENLMLYEQIRHYADELEHRVIERTAELKQAKDRAETILNNASDAVILIDADGTIQRVNPAFAQLFGTKDDSRKHLLAFVESSFEAPISEAMLDVVTHKQIRHIEVLARRKDGSLFDAEIALAPIEESSTSQAGMVCSLRDITDRKQAEQQRIELVAERERVKILADFIRDASHDLRTPLSTVNTSLYLLQRLTEPEEQGHHIKIIEQQVTHLGKLIEGLLTMTRLDSEAVFNFRPVDLNRLLRDLEIRTRLMAKGKGIVVNLKLALGIPLVRADERELYQAFENLLENAVQFTPDCGSINLQTWMEDQAVAIEIRDSGIGINESDLPHIFERFFRADRARSTSTGGLGLGLAIARKIIEAHGGSIDVKSALDQGTIFVIRLPRNQ